MLPAESTSNVAEGEEGEGGGDAAEVSLRAEPNRYVVAAFALCVYVCVLECFLVSPHVVAPCMIGHYIESLLFYHWCLQKCIGLI